MPTNPYNYKDHNPLGSADALFVGRGEELRSIRDFLEPSKWPAASTPVVCHIWGNGGYGKSTLLRAVQSAQSKTGNSLRLVTANLDLDHFHSMLPAPDFLWHLRCALVRGGVKTPLYDFYYLLYFSSLRRPGQSLTIKSLAEDIAARSKALGEKLSGSAEVDWIKEIFDSEAVADLVELAGGIGKQIKTVETFSKLNQLRAKRATRLALREVGYILDPADPSALQKIAPEILALDLASAVADKNSSPIVLSIDGLDRIQSRETVPGRSSLSEHALERLVASFLFHPNDEIKAKVRFLFLGRNPLNWAEQFDDPLSVSSWNAFAIQHRLRGLPVADCEIFLDQLSAVADSNGALELGESLRQHKQRLLRFLQKTDSDVDAPVFPGNLGLLFEYSGSGGDLEQLTRLDTPAVQMEERYFRSIDERLRKVLEVFSVIGTIEEPIYTALVKNQNIVGYDINEFNRFKRLPYVSEGEYAGSIRLDDHIESYLLKRLTLTPEESLRARKIAAAGLAAISSTGRESDICRTTLGRKAFANRFLAFLDRCGNFDLLSITDVVGPWLDFEFSFENDTHIAGVARLEICRKIANLLESMNPNELHDVLRQYPESATGADVAGAIGQIHKLFVVHKLPVEANKMFQILIKGGVVTTERKTDESAKTMSLESFDFNIDRIYGAAEELGVNVAAGQLWQIWIDLQEHKDSRYRTILLMTTTRYLGDLFRHLDDYEKSLEWMQKHLDLSQSINDADSTELAKSRLGYVLALMENRRYDKAERILDQALKVLKPRLGQNHPHVINAEFFAGEMLIVKGRRVEGLNRMRDCIARLRETESGDEGLASGLESRLSYLERNSSSIYTPFGMRR